MAIIMTFAAHAAVTRTGSRSNNCAGQPQPAKRKINASVSCRQFSALPALFLALCFLPGCSSPIDEYERSAPRVISLDPLDAPAPQLELIGLEQEQLANSTCLTVELLDLDAGFPLQLSLDLDLLPTASRPGQSERPGDLHLRLTAAETVTYELAGTGHLPNGSIDVEWDFKLDRVRITLPFVSSSSSPPFTIRVQTLKSGSTLPADTLGPVLSDARDTRRANLLLAFWNVFRGETPALALRSWDGAHSGPAGERFGLAHLLDSVREFEIPINLLDLNTPEAIAGLDYLGELPGVTELIKRGLLYLPSTLPEDYSPGHQPLEMTRVLLLDRMDVSSNYGLPSAAWLTLDTPQLTEADIDQVRQLAFSGVIAPFPIASAGTQSARIYRNGGMLLIPRPRSDAALSAADDGGLSIGWRQALIEAALSGEETNLLVLGGSLPQTFWGDPEQARESMAWLAAHPWITALTLDQVVRLALPYQSLDLPAGLKGDPDPAEDRRKIDFSDSPGRTTLDILALDLYARASSTHSCLSEDDPRWDEAWKACERPPADSLNQLRQLSLESLALLDFAREWSRDVACTAPGRDSGIKRADIDHDGFEEAMLWNSDLLAIFDPVGGRLSALFACSPEYGVSTVIAPRPFQAIGLSDPSGWNLDSGSIHETALPLLAGGFLSPSDMAEYFEISRTTDGLELEHPQGLYSVRFSLSGPSLRAEYSVMHGVRRQYELGFLVAPERMFEPGFSGAFQLLQQNGALEIQIEGGLTLRLQSTHSTLEIDSFLDSPAPILNSEDPNLEYPPGHYLPMPFILVQDWMDDGELISISLLPGR